MASGAKQVKSVQSQPKQQNSQEPEIFSSFYAQQTESGLTFLE